MTDPNEASDNVQTATHSQGEADRIRRDDRRPGTDLGGTAVASESATERTLTKPGTLEETPDSQSRNPL